MLDFLPPTAKYRTVLKKGMYGHDVWALQILVNQLTTGPTPMAEDGAFGPLTEAKIVGFQKTEKITADGIAGIVTQTRLAGRATAKLTEVPAGLLMGIIAGESGFACGCTEHSVAGGIDCGFIQDRVYTSEYGDARFRVAFGLEAVEETAQKLRRIKDGYYGKPGCKTHEKAWKVATGYHNWPAAAERIAAGTFDAWRYTAVDGNGVRHTYGVDDDAWWVYRWGIPGVRTARQWFDFYVATKVVYVKTWTP